MLYAPHVVANWPAAASSAQLHKIGCMCVGVGPCRLVVRICDGDSSAGVGSYDGDVLAVGLTFAVGVGPCRLVVRIVV